MQLISIQQYSAIEEYKFTVAKIKLILNNSKSTEIYLKRIKAGKIKETIFCFWSLLYEEYLKNNNQKKEKIPRKVVILQDEKKQKQNIIKLTLEQELNYYVEINLVEIYKIKKDNERREECLDNNYDILFIGIKKLKN